MVKVKLPFRSQRFTELTASQWQSMKELVDDGRKRKTCLRRIFNAILKITRTGCQWRNLDEKYPPWQTVYYYFHKWKRNGTWTAVLTKLVRKERQNQGRKPTPSVVAVDSQSVKKGSFICLDTGIDGGKLINGRKRHLAVDTLGLPWSIHVSAANVNDGKEGNELLWRLGEATDRLELIRADHAYQGDFVEFAQYYKWSVEITQKPESKKGFVPQSGRWQVERSFAWFNFYRRLSRDFEKTVESSVAFIQIAFISILLAR